MVTEWAQCSKGEILNFQRIPQEEKTVQTVENLPQEKAFVVKIQFTEKEEALS